MSTIPVEIRKKNRFVGFGVEVVMVILMKAVILVKSWWKNARSSKSIQVKSELSAPGTKKETKVGCKILDLTQKRGKFKFQTKISRHFLFLFSSSFHFIL